MISARKRAANQANAQASTGPKSAAGKATSTQNARRHGLNLPVWADRRLLAEAEKLARDIAGEDHHLLILARPIAEAQIDLLRVRSARHGLISRCWSDTEYRPAVNVMESVRLPGKMLRVLDRGEEISPAMQEQLVRPEGAEKLALVLSALARRLAVFDRYERRALSRRKFAIRAYDVARSLELRKNNPIAEKPVLAKRSQKT